MNNTANFNTFNSTLELAQMPAKRRLDTILNHQDPSALLKSLSTHDLLLTIIDIGAQDCLELVELLNPQQVQELLDLEIWHNDAIDPTKAGHYFSMLFAASKDRACEQLLGLDIEFIGLMLKMVAKIYDLSEGEEPDEDASLTSLTPDRRFYICFNDEGEHKALAQSMHAFLENLYSQDLKFAFGILERVRFEMASGLEEESLRWRTSRLMDMGILPSDERLEYFAPLSVTQLKPQTNLMHATPVSKQSSLIRLTKNSHDKFIFLSAALNNCSDEEKEHFNQEIAHAGLNMFASLSGEFGNREKLLQVCEYVSSLCEFGIVHKTMGQIDSAFDALKTCRVKELIRLGRTVLTTIRKNLLAEISAGMGLFGKDFCLADSPLREVARALCLPEPRFYHGLLDQNKFDLSYFTTLTQVTATLDAINELKFRATIVGPKILGATLEQLADHSELCHAGIYARFLLNDFLGNQDSLAPIDHANQSRIFSKGEKLSGDFVAHAKLFATELAQKLTEQSNSYDLNQANEKCLELNTAVLIQLEQNHQLLVGA